MNYIPIVYFYLIKVRQILSDFSVMIAIVLASGLDFLIDLGTEKLKIPSEFKVTAIFYIQITLENK